MKLKRILAVILSATVAFGFWSCQEEEIETGIDPNLPAPSNLTYDEDNSSATSMTVYWDASAPDAAGATSYTVQLLTAPDQGDNYDSSTSKTLQSTAEVHDLAMFGGLSSFEKYLIRVRANYKRSKYSEWTYITLNGEPVFHEVGFGMVDPSLPTIDTCGYDATLSTAESMWFNFDAHTAKAANAAEVVVRIVNKKSTLPSYTNTESISATGTEFVNLTNKNRYTVWARAAYKLSDSLPEGTILKIQSDCKIHQYKEQLRKDLFEKLTQAHAFWSYSGVTMETLPDELLIEKVFVHLDMADIDKLFELFPKKFIQKVWRENMAVQGEYLFDLNVMIALYFFHIRKPEAYLRRQEMLHLKKLTRTL